MFSVVYILTIGFVLQMGHDAFMAVFMKLLMVFLMREENDEYAPRILKFIGSFVASFGEEVGPDESTHLIIQFVFKELLSVSLCNSSTPTSFSRFYL